MFFHTKREAECAKIFGLTDSVGITLINQKHKYPFFVEQEERYHGAFLGNTTYGGLYQLFDSFTTTPVHQYEIKQVPGTVEQFALKNLMDICSRSRRRIIDDSENVQESFAKYLAYTKQFSELNEWPTDLNEQFENDCKNYSLLNELSQTIGKPFSFVADEFAFKAETVYVIAKWALNTTELDNLYQLANFSDIKKAIEDDNYWGLFGPNQRAQDALEFLREINLPDLWKSNHDKLEDNTESSLFGRKYAKIVYEILGIELAKKSHTHTIVISSGELSVRTVTVAERIANLTNGLFHSLSKDHVGLTYSPSRITGEFWNYPQYFSSICSYDPAFKVTYDQRYNNNLSWQIVYNIDHLKEIKNNYYCGNAFVYPSINEQGKLDCFLILEIFTADRSRASFLSFIFQVSNVKDMLVYTDIFENQYLSIILLPFPVIGLSDLNEVVKKLSLKANILYWSLSGFFSDIIGFFAGDSYLFMTSRQLLKIQQKAKVVRDVPYMKFKFANHGVSFSSVPTYYAEALDRIKEHNKTNDVVKEAYDKVVLQHPSRPGTFVSINNKPVKFKEKQANLLLAAAKVYEAFYEVDILPSYLPLYNSMDMYNMIKIYNND